MSTHEWNNQANFGEQTPPPLPRASSLVFPRRFKYGGISFERDTSRDQPVFDNPEISDKSDGSKSPLDNRNNYDASTGGCFLGKNNLGSYYEFQQFQRHEQYTFVAEPLKMTAGWVTSKWIENLKLPEINWKTERAFHAWVMEAARSCQRCSPTWNVFSNVVRLSCPKIYYAAFKASEVRGFPPNTDVFADKVARYLFKHDEEVRQIELGMFLPRKYSDVQSASDGFAEAVDIYLAMCCRRGRHPVLGVHQLREGFVSRLPAAIERRIRRVCVVSRTQLDELIEHALHLEASEVVFEKPEAFQQDYRFNNPMIEPQQRRTYQTVCRKCGQQGHFAKDCAIGSVRCSQCGAVGHVGNACKSFVASDAAGVPRVLVDPNQGGANIKVKFDTTTPEAVTTVGGVVEKLTETYSKRRRRAKEKYREKVEAEGRIVQQRPEPVVMAVLSQNAGQTSSSSAILTCEEKGDDISEPLWIGLGEQRLGSAMRGDMIVNGKRAVVILDSGAGNNCISASNARNLQIDVDSSHLRAPIQGVGGVVISRRSVPIEIKHPSDPEKVVTETFQIVEEEIPTLIGRATLSNLGISINFSTNEVTTNCGAKCFAYPVEDQEKTKLDTISQSIFQAPEEAIKDAEKKIKPDIELTPDLLKRWRDMMLKFSQCWFKPKAANCKTHQMRLEVLGHPRRSKAIELPEPMLKILHKQVDDLLDSKVILSMPDSEWVSPCFLVPKKGGTNWRLVIDYRYVNSLMTDDPYQMPLISEIFARLRGKRWFTLLDLNWGFWNLPLHPDSIKYTGFAVPGRGVFVWTVTPFGIKVSPTNFQKCIEIPLLDLIAVGKVFVYIDDIVICANTLSELLDILEDVLTRLDEAGFFLNLGKSFFLRRSINLLGHVLSENEVRPDPMKVQGIINARIPANKNEVRSFVAASSYLRNFIKSFSEIIAPISDLTKARVPYQWGDEQQKAFAEIKAKMVEVTYLSLPDYSRPFYIYTDASDIGVGAVLAQKKDNKELEYVAFISKKLSDAQKAWDTSEREAYAIVWACERLEGYIKGVKCNIRTDHKALESLRDTTKPKLRRWAVRLMEFSPYIQYVDSSDNTVADWLSRCGSVEEQLPQYAYVPLIAYLRYSIDPSLFPLPNKEQLKSYIEKEIEERKVLPIRWFEGSAYDLKSRRLYIPECCQQQLVIWFHGSRYGGHQGIRRTEKRLKKYVFWPGMRKTIEEIVGGCILCNLMKTLNTRSTVRGALNKPRLFELISLDFIGKRTFRGKSYYILVIIDHFSRFMLAKSSNSPSEMAVIHVLQREWLPSFGSPGGVLCDHGGAFIGGDFVNFINKSIQSRLIYASVEYPKGNGINESSHRALETGIETHPGWTTMDFEDILSDCVLVYNATPNLAIGDSPASRVYGQDPLLPGLGVLQQLESEEMRQEKLKDARLWPILKDLLKDFEEDTTMEGNSEVEINEGAIVTYRLSKTESEKLQHISGERHYLPKRSLPYRVVKVLDKSLVLIPMWYKGGERQVPLSECKVIKSSTPNYFESVAKRLFPLLPLSLLEKELMPESSGPIDDDQILHGPEDEKKSKPKEKRRRNE